MIKINDYLSVSAVDLKRIVEQAYPKGCHYVYNESIYHRPLKSEYCIYTVSGVTYIKFINPHTPQVCTIKDNYVEWSGRNHTGTPIKRVSDLLPCEYVRMTQEDIDTVLNSQYISHDTKVHKISTFPTNGTFYWNPNTSSVLPNKEHIYMKKMLIWYDVCEIDFGPIVDSKNVREAHAKDVRKLLNIIESSNNANTSTVTR